MIDINKVKEEYKEIFRKEGSYEAFNCDGLKCRILRGPFGNWCGYVGVNKNHPIYGMRYSYYLEKLTPLQEAINNIEVHGGLTYARNYLYLQPEKNLTWFGFDTSHYGDESISIGSISTGGIYRTKEYTIEETKKLAKQINKIKLLNI